MSDKKDLQGEGNCAARKFDAEERAFVKSGQVERKARKPRTHSTALKAKSPRGDRRTWRDAGALRRGPSPNFQSLGCLPPRLRPTLFPAKKS